MLIYWDSQHIQKVTFNLPQYLIKNIKKIYDTAAYRVYNTLHWQCTFQQTFLHHIVLLEGLYRGLGNQPQSDIWQFQVLPQGSQIVTHSKWHGHNDAPASPVRSRHTVNIFLIHMETV